MQLLPIDDDQLSYIFLTKYLYFNTCIYEGLYCRGIRVPREIHFKPYKKHLKANAGIIYYYMAWNPLQDVPRKIGKENLSMKKIPTCQNLALRKKTSMLICSLQI